MELLEHPQTLVAAGQIAGPTEQLDLLLQLLQALAYLHCRGILHQDLKPENALVSQGRAHLLNFGLSVRHTGQQYG